MSLPLRQKYFLWLSAALGMFTLIQLLAWFLWEMTEYWNGNDQVLGEGLGELVLLVGVNMASLPFLLIFVWYLSKRMLAPLQQISETATQISQGQLQERIEVAEAEDELGVLANTLNEAFDRYQEANEKLLRFGADASHQLRNPLTSIRTAGEVCLSRSRSDQDYRETIESMLEDASQLTGVVERLLMLARLEAHELRRKFTQLNLSAVAEAIRDPYRPLCEEKQIQLKVDSPPEVLVFGDEALLGQVVANLIDNAVRFTPSGGDITIRIRRLAHPDSVCLDVVDSGPGVPESFENHLFDRFRKASALPSEGVGLGLAVVREIVHVHGGSATYLRTEAACTCFRVCLPVS